MNRFTPLVLAAVFCAGISTAQAVPIFSNAGDTTSQDSDYNGSFTAVVGGAVQITPHPAWQQVPISPGDPAVWISYKNSGVGPGASLAPFIAGCSDATPGACMPLMTVTETLAGGGNLHIEAWADDTLSIRLFDGIGFTTLVNPNFTQNACADGPPGCEPLESVTVDVALAPGNYELQFLVFQVGQNTDPQNNPFGLLYTGSFDPVRVPEPATFTLLGAGLIGLGLAARRRRSKAA